MLAAMRAPIRLGLQIPNFNFPGVSEEDLFEHLSDIATTAESSGFDSLFVMDHLHQIPGIGPPENWMLEGNTILAALAARTSKANLGLLVGGVTYRNPALMAKIATTLDVISGGRAILGIGAAWFEDEHVAYGFDFPSLGERFEHLEDALQILRAMFTQDTATVDGKHHSAAEARNNPRPIRGDIPIMIGGSGEKKTLRMVAQYADASNFFGDSERIRHLIGVLEGHCERLGRDPSEITTTRLGTIVLAPTHEEAEREVAALRERGMPERMVATLVAGDPDAVVEQASELLDAGLDGLIFNSPGAHDLETVALIGETLGPLMAERGAAAA
jgi:F420-dependent oxidoreductase-like protein